MSRLKPVLACLVAIVCLSFGPPALAQDKTAKIRTLLELSQTENLFQQLLPTILNQTQAAVREMRPDIPDEVWAIVMEEGEAAFRESLGAFIEKSVPIYERNFTEAEIDGMLAFYGSEVGRSVVKKLPKITAESMAIGQQWGMAVGQEIQRRMLSKLSDEGYQI